MCVCVVGGLCTHRPSSSSVLFNRGAVRWPTGNTDYVTSADRSFTRTWEKRWGATYITPLNIYSQGNVSVWNQITCAVLQCVSPLFIQQDFAKTNTLFHSILPQKYVCIEFTVQATGRLPSIFALNLNLLCFFLSFDCFLCV